ncbi:MAG: phosphotransferase [Oligoflexia bacterium]|nr:phosphotransferase [Oligoflexia bacterium]
MTPLTDADPYSKFLKQSLGKDKGINVFALAGDASARKYFRVHVGDLSYVLMSWEPFESEEAYPFLNVQKHFLKHGVQVPKVLNFSKDEGYVLLEDLGDLTLERKFLENLHPEHALEYYKLSLVELAKIHYKASSDDKNSCLAFKIEFNTEKLLWELNYAREHLLEGFLKIQFSEKESKILDKEFRAICDRLHNEPKFIAHRDYHSRNIMIKAGTTRVIDFQDARLGPIQYDLVSLLRDSYVNLDDKVSKKLLDYYLDLRKSYKQSTINKDNFDLIYELQTIQRCFKACGSFASFYNTRADKRYLKYIGSTLTRVKKSLLQFNEYKALTDLFNSYGIFEKEISPTL